MKSEPGSRPVGFTHRMTLNTNQRKIVLWAAAVVVAMSVFPPWIGRYGGPGTTYVEQESHLGYSFIGTPPSSSFYYSRKEWDSASMQMKDINFPVTPKVAIDFSILSVQYIGVAVAACAIAFAKRE